MQSGVAIGCVVLRVTSQMKRISVITDAIILPKITCYRGVSGIPICDWPHLRGLELADPVPASAENIDVLLGANVYADIISKGLRKGSSLQPVAQGTILGWILAGPCNACEGSGRDTTHQCNVSDPLSALVRRFWEQEELLPAAAPLTPDEQKCEEFFVRIHARTPEGRYVVRLPVTSPLPNLLETKRAASASLMRMEKRHLKQPKFHELYNEFMQTYSKLNHMSKISANSPRPERVCDLPHHGVLRDANTTTRLRVVFNGSWTDSQGQSLNRHLLIGQNLLSSSVDVLLRWRLHRFVLAADIEKMYRQILVHEEDRDLQQIL